MKARSRILITTVIAGLASGYAFAADPPTPASAPASAMDDGASVAIARRVVEAAGAFDHYFRSAGAVRADFDGPAAVSGALMTGAAYESRQLEEGAVAYAALVALQQPTFVDALSNFSADRSERRAYVERLTATPELVIGVPGAAQAAGQAAGALDEMGSNLVTRGQAVTDAAYKVQQQPWALEAVPEPADRLARVRAAGATPGRMSPSETRALLTHLVERRGGPEPVAAGSQPRPVVLRGLVLAAAAVLGEAGETRAEALSPLLRDPETGGCLRQAKLDLQQCLAAAGPQYEDVFCAGKHGMAQTGQCIVKAAGTAEAEGVRVPIAGDHARNAAATISVPVARTAAAPASADPADRAARDAYSEAHDAYSEAPSSDTD